MSYFDSLKNAISYVENHLNDNIDLLSIAKEAGYSFYHFERIFKFIVGDSIKDYIRKRRITEAAKKLTSTDNPIIEIALEYGYESREAFSRAFEKVYGRKPSDVRKGGLLYCIREPMDYDYMMFKYKMMREGLQPSLLNMPAITVVGKRWTVKADGSNYQDIPLLWNSWYRNSEWEKITERKYDYRCMGICIFSDTDTFDYMIGHEVNTTDHTPDGMESYILEPSLCAMFKTVGPITETVQKTWDYIYGIWLNESEYKHAETYNIEYYYYSDGKLTADLCVPLVSK